MKTDQCECIDCGKLVTKDEGWFCYDGSGSKKNGVVCDACYSKRNKDDE